MSEASPTVFVVDDDADVCRALSRLIGSVALQARTFRSAREFLNTAHPERPCCLVLDVRLPDLNGLDLQAKLAQTDCNMPIIFITGHGDIPMSVRAMKAGAIEFLSKPFKDQDLLDAIQQAIERDKLATRERAELSELRSRYVSLTPREAEVLPLLASGLANKAVAAQLGTTEKTIKVHRAHIMQKMKAKSLADLVRIAQRLQIAPSDKA